MEWILTDCFDTVLLRKCNPETVKRKWAKDISLLFGYEISSRDLYDIRQAAEAVLPAFYDYTMLSVEILRRARWRLIRDHRECPLEDAFLLEEMYRAELKQEIAALEVNQEHVESLKASGCRVAVVSDMYCGERFLRDLFDAFGIGALFERIFVSCDCKCRKIDAHNSLYEKVLAELAIAPSDTVMYDDMDLCLMGAEQSGIKGIQVKAPKAKRVKDTHRSAERALDKLLCKRYSSVKSLQNYSATFYLFIERLYKQCVANQFDRVYFLSREGEFLKTLFDAYCALHHGQIATRYLYVSRKAVLSASFGDDPLSPGELIEKHFRFHSIKGILEKVGFSEEEIGVFEKETATDINIKVERYWTTSAWQTICRHPGFTERYGRMVKEKRALLKAYLSQEGLEDGSRSALVDVGWRGTMQDVLFAHLDASTVIDGFYYGLTTPASCDRYNRKHGLIFSGIDICSPDYEIWSFYHTQMESLLSASHPGTSSYRREESGRILPVFQDWGSEEDSYRMLAPIQSKLLESFAAIDAVLVKFGYEAEDFYRWFIAAHIKTTLSIGISKSAFQKQLQFNQIDNIGNNQSNSSDMIRSYRLMGNLGRIFKNLDTLKNPVRMIRILQTNNLHFLLPLILFSLRRKFLKESRQRLPR